MIKNALLDNAEAAKIAAIQSLQDAAAQDILCLSMGNAEGISAVAQAAIGALGGEMINAGNDAVTAAGMVASFNSEVFKAAAALGATIDAPAIQAQANAIVGAYKNIAASIASVTIDTAKYTGATTGAGKAAKNAAGGVNELKAALNKEKKALEEVQDALKKEQNRLKIYGKAILDEIQKRIDKLNDEKKAQEDAYDAEIKALQDAQKEREKAYDAEVKALQEKKDALDKANDEQDRAIKLAELEQALAEAQTRRTARVYKEGEGYTWQTNQKDIDNAQENLDDQLREWNYKDKVQAIDDEIDAIQKLKDAYKEQIEEQIDKINELKDAYDDQIQAQIDKLNALKETYNDTIGLIGTSWEDYQTMLAAQAEFQGMTYESMIGYHTGYKDSVIENMMQLAEVEQQLTDVQNRLNEATNATSAATGGNAGGGGTGAGLADSFATATSAADSLLLEIQELAAENETLRERESDLTETVAGLTEGTAAHFHALDELGVVQNEIAGNTDLLNQKSAEYIEAVGAETDATNEQKQAQIEKLAELLAAYDIDYLGIADILNVHLQNLESVCGIHNATYESMKLAVDGFSQQCSAKFSAISDAANSMASSIESAAARAKAAMRSLSDAGTAVSAVSPAPVKAYASGTSRISKPGGYMVDDAGREIVVRKNKGRYTTLEVGDGVVRSDLTNTLMSAAVNPQRMITERVNAYFQSQQPALSFGGSGTVSVNVGDIVMNSVQDVDGFARALDANIGNVITQIVNKRR